MLGAVGFASGSLAANERLFRLIRGPAVIRHHARYLARTSGAMTVGQLGGAAVIAAGCRSAIPRSRAVRHVECHSRGGVAPARPMDTQASMRPSHDTRGNEKTAEAEATAVV